MCALVFNSDFKTDAGNAQVSPTRKSLPKVPSPKSLRDDNGAKVPRHNTAITGRFIMCARAGLAGYYMQNYERVVDALTAIDMLKRDSFLTQPDGTANLLVVQPGASFADIMRLYGKQIVFDGCYVISFDKLLNLLNDDGEIWDGVESADDDDATLSSEAALAIVKRAAIRPRTADRITRVRFALGRVTLSEPWRSTYSVLNAYLKFVEPFVGNEKGVSNKHNWSTSENKIVLRPNNEHEFVKLLRAECRFADADEELCALEEFATLKRDDEAL